MIIGSELLIETPFLSFWGTPVRPSERYPVRPAYADSFTVSLAMAEAGCRQSFSVHCAFTSTSLFLQPAKLMEKLVSV